MNWMYFASGFAALVTICSVLLILFILGPKISAVHRWAIGMIGFGTVLSFWMGLIPSGVLEHWPFLVPRAGIILLLEANYGRKVRSLLATQWTFGRKVATVADAGDQLALTEAWLAEPVPPLAGAFNPYAAHREHRRHF